MSKKNEKKTNQCQSSKNKDGDYKWTPKSKNLDYVFNKEYYEYSIFRTDGKKLVENYECLEKNEDNLKNNFDNAHDQIINLSKNYTEDYKKLWLYQLKNNINKERKNVQNDEGQEKFQIGTGILKVVYPGLVIGIGNPHGTSFKGDIQIGMSFDYVTGLPFVSGSSLKGKLRSIMEKLIYDEYKLEDNISLKTKEENDRKNDDDGITKISLSDYLTIDISNPKKKLTKNQIQELVDIIFEGLKFESDENQNIVFIEDKPVKKEIPMLERDIFYGGIVIPKKNKAFLKEDFLAPHPSNIESPNVLKFLAIGPDTEIEFFFSLKDSVLISEDEKIIMTSEQKLDLFLKLLKDFGVGAKANLGYGIME